MAPDPLHQLEAAHSREPQIEDQELRPEHPDKRPGVNAFSVGKHPIPKFPQEDLDESSGARVILDEYGPPGLSHDGFAGG
jgi:hypothetical protein